MAYVSKDEKKIPITDPSGRWSDMTLLPEWEEEYYDVYTARRHGKWVMLKALKPRYADDPEMQRIMRREFETRYPLSHPNIVSVTDMEDIPGIGPAIITDDAYGYPLSRLIAEHKITPRILRRLETQLLDAIEYIQENHIVHSPVTTDTIYFTGDQDNLKLINVGFDRREHLTQADMSADIAAFGHVLSQAIDATGERLPQLRRIADRCCLTDPRKSFSHTRDITLAIERRSNSGLFTILISIIAVLSALLIWLTIQ